MCNKIIGDAPVPTRLYKYRNFDLYALRMLTNSFVYFSDPAQFNDPLDCKPELSVGIDIDINSLETLLMRMTPESSRLLNDCKMAADFYCSMGEQADYYFRSVASRVKETLYSQMGRIGVLSLAQSWNCPLMWSHYGDQHKGICLGFDTSHVSDLTPKKVNYEGQRCINCSDLIGHFIDGNTEALERIKETFFFTKAKEWKYEREWRVANDKNGEEPGPFELREVYFGMRCDDAVKTAVLNLKHSRALEYYEVFPGPKSFELIASQVDAEARRWYMPRPSARVAFSLAPVG
jgi:hypothetical protein